MCEDTFVLVNISVLVSFDKSMVDFCKFVVVGMRQIKMSWQANIVWGNFCELLLDSHWRHDLDFGSLDVHLLLWLLLFVVDRDH